MDKKKEVRPFKFKKISKPLKKEQKNKDNKLFNTNINTSNDLINSIGDKEILNTDEKIRVIDFVFKQNKEFLKICHSCGGKIKGKYFSFYSYIKDIIYCFGCYQSLFTCDNCGMPAKQVGPKLKSLYCSLCKVNKMCDCCKTHITAKEAYRIKYIKGTYCKNCYNNAKTCTVCKIPIPEKEYFEIGQNIICKSCSKRTITPNDARNLNNMVTAFINKQFAIKNHYNCQTKELDFNMLNPHYNNHNSLGYSVNEKLIIYYKGITKERAIGVFAYEYSKIILKILNPNIKNINLVEPFAMWLKSYVLTYYGEVDEVKQIKSYISTYPKLKTLFNIEILGGIPKVIQKIVKGEVGKQ